MPVVLSLNIGARRATDFAKIGVTGIDKRPVDGPLEVRPPGPKGTAGSGVVSDEVCDWRHHGGDHQAVYAYAREDLDHWEAELGVSLRSGGFGENLTTQGIDITHALIGERWRVGTTTLEISGPRVPCRTFAGFLEQRGWVKRFTQAALPGGYFRVLEAGMIGPGDEITVVHRPDHGLTVATAFRALLTDADLLPELLKAEDALPPEVIEVARRRTVIELDSESPH